MDLSSDATKGQGEQQAVSSAHRSAGPPSCSGEAKMVWRPVARRSGLEGVSTRRFVLRIVWGGVPVRIHHGGEDTATNQRHARTGHGTPTVAMMMKWLNAEGKGNFTSRVGIITIVTSLGVDGA